MKLAYVHDWLVKFAGAEKVLEAMYSVMGAPIYTLFLYRASLKDTVLEDATIHVSFLQSIPGIAKYYKNFMPFYKKAIESFNLNDYDVVISSSHAVAKGFRKRKGQCHICYCHTPMRYVWDLYEEYMSEMPFYKRFPFALTAKWMRNWDLENSRNVDFFIANSKFVAERIKRIYGRDSEVVYPPVNVEDFQVVKEKDDYYLFVGRLINAYKKPDIVIKAFNKLGKKLLVVGEGDDEKNLRLMAEKNVEFIGWLNKKELKEVLGKARALIFPSMDDFGMVSVEAQACGTPVIAFKGGGAKETVIEGKTGIFFEEQTVEAVIDAIRMFERVESSFKPEIIRKNAEKFSRRVFEVKFREILRREAGIEL